ncbi:ORF120 [Agrotis segetum granulovirus]|uniref:ORF120 n=1 Tax=Agrotis segetum granulosis virus TaxID=10464 RepID=Q6QXI0_GVAS|nr:hypothetical protein AsGV136 [Agrotis segetum granulovirus]AAS82618.1 ORF120 [Agrotis segetum granulovirus]AHN92172.1 hypothetical protein AsGV133 [Agrotis segetum granulovirus]AKN63409.1 hypothetical protein AsGV136 [Agrotis segetum granulovirus]
MHVNLTVTNVNKCISESISTLKKSSSDKLRKMSVEQLQNIHVKVGGKKAFKLNRMEINHGLIVLRFAAASLTDSVRYIEVSGLKKNDHPFQGVLTTKCSNENNFSSITATQNKDGVLQFKMDKETEQLQDIHLNIGGGCNLCFTVMIVFDKIIERE